MLSSSSRCWTPVMLASNVGHHCCQRLTLVVGWSEVLKHWLDFIRRFPRFIAFVCTATPMHATWALFWFCTSLLHCFPCLHCFLFLCIDFYAFALFSAPLHRSPCPCIVFCTLAPFSMPLHHFPRPCIVFRALTSFSVPTFALSLACRLHCLVFPAVLFYCLHLH